MIKRRSAVAKPPRKTFVGVAGNGLNLGQSVEAMMTTFPRKKKIKITLLPIMRVKYYYTRPCRIDIYERNLSRRMGIRVKWQL